MTALKHHACLCCIEGKLLLSSSCSLPFFASHCCISHLLVWFSRCSYHQIFLITQCKIHKYLIIFLWGLSTSLPGLWLTESSTLLTHNNSCNGLWQHGAIWRSQILEIWRLVKKDVKKEYNCTVTFLDTLNEKLILSRVTKSKVRRLRRMMQWAKPASVFYGLVMTLNWCLYLV